MSSLIDDFQVVLPSNVSGNQRNKLYFYLTALSRPIDLSRECYVALMNIA